MQCPVKIEKFPDLIQDGLVSTRKELSFKGKNGSVHILKNLVAFLKEPSCFFFILFFSKDSQEFFFKTNFVLRLTFSCRCPKSSARAP